MIWYTILLMCSRLANIWKPKSVMWSILKRSTDSLTIFMRKVFEDRNCVGSFHCKNTFVIMETPHQPETMIYESRTSRREVQQKKKSKEESRKWQVLWKQINSWHKILQASFDSLRSFNTEVVQRNRCPVQKKGKRRTVLL